MHRVQAHSHHDIKLQTSSEAQSAWAGSTLRLMGSCSISTSWGASSHISVSCAVTHQSQCCSKIGILNNILKTPATSSSKLDSFCRCFKKIIKNPSCETHSRIIGPTHVCVSVHTCKQVHTSMHTCASPCTLMCVWEVGSNPATLRVTDSHTPAHTHSHIVGASTHLHACTCEQAHTCDSSKSEASFLACGRRPQSCAPTWGRLSEWGKREGYPFPHLTHTSHRWMAHPVAQSYKNVNILSRHGEHKLSFAQHAPHVGSGYLLRAAKP